MHFTVSNTQTDYVPISCEISHRRLFQLFETEAACSSLSNIITIFEAKQDNYSYCTQPLLTALVLGKSTSIYANFLPIIRLITISAGSW